MNDFWNNIAQYTRFLITSLAGLILIILTPFKNVFKISKFRIFLIFGILFFFMVLCLIIRNMVGL